jgi:hypothetical protein
LNFSHSNLFRGRYSDFGFDVSLGETTSALALTLEGSPVWDFEIAGFRSGDFTIGGAHYVLPPSYSEAPLRLIYHSALLLLLGFATIVILRNIFEQRVVRSDDVLGAVCGYLLAAAAWSNLFMLIEIFVPGSYSVGQGFGAGLDSWHGRTAVFNYVSLGSLTGVGSGEVVPVRPPATVLTTLEAVFGQFYIAIVVAQLVGARLSQAIKRDRPDSQ